MRYSSPVTIQFSQVEEMVLEVLQHCDIASLVAASHGNRQFRRLVRSILSTRLVHALSPCIPDYLLLQFFVLLDRTESAIIGSTAFKTLTPHCTWETADVNIVTPLYGFTLWEDFFAMHHFIASEDDRFSRLQNNVPQAGIWYHDETKEIKKIIVIESAHDSVFLPVLSSPLTSQMNIITSSHIYCLYPTLTVDRISVNSFGGLPHSFDSVPIVLSELRLEAVDKQGLRFIANGERSDKTCGVECPKLERALRGYRNVGIFQWGGYQLMTSMDRRS
ncbi:uncharacterized protein EV420DRAFT_703079 [Desarmillaria tabescens]|uniref:F-box domain-containing protein n=1 Tax=Armillaria tabescens TaxID=1929756 RepID=A0AA39K294_ARMTA|nr:uncharacterized protein EV420DRAFT_703079 [Desarmillaria tabescens]KAK0452021.1 hypothetical protein EV420DRAFT_703079 [Desarmillaria tabescens]